MKLRPTCLHSFFSQKENSTLLENENIGYKLGLYSCSSKNPQVIFNVFMLDVYFINRNNYFSESLEL